MVLLRIAAMGLAVLLAAGAPAFADEGNVDEGREVFKFRCWNCHMSPEGTLPESPEETTTPVPQWWVSSGGPPEPLKDMTTPTP